MRLRSNFRKPPQEREGLNERTASRTNHTAEVRQLLDDFEKADYFGLADTYNMTHNRVEIAVSAGGCSQVTRETVPCYITDLPATTTVITLTLGNRTKTVSDTFDAPPELESLEDQIDKLSHSEKWVSRRIEPR